MAPSEGGVAVKLQAIRIVGPGTCTRIGELICERTPNSYHEVYPDGYI